MDQIPDITTYIIGWRSWIVNSDRLLGVRYETCRLVNILPIIWLPREALHAKHHEYWVVLPSLDEISHTAPARSCTCGIYAMKTLEQFYTPEFTFAECIYRLWKISHMDIGRVALWGRISEHENGYRAEFAYPLSLFYASDTIFKQYGIVQEETPTSSSL